MARQEYLAFVILLAVALDAALIYWLRRVARRRQQGLSKGAPVVTLWGEYSPVLTWVRYTLPTWIKTNIARPVNLKSAVSLSEVTVSGSSNRTIHLELEFNLDVAEQVSFTIGNSPAIGMTPPLADALVSEPKVDEESSKWRKAILRLRSRALPLARLVGWLLLLCSAVLPPYWVVRDRWFDLSPRMPSWLEGFWEQNLRAHNITLPAYFGAVLMCWLALLGLMRALGKAVDDPAMLLTDQPTGQSLPTARQRQISAWGMLAALACALCALALEQTTGRRWGILYLAGVLLWLLFSFLREYSIKETWNSAYRHWKPAFFMAGVHILLLVFLYHYYGRYSWSWFWGCMLALALLSLLRSKIRLPGIFLVINLALIFYTLRIDGWEFSVIGDEYSFFDYAQELARNHSWISMLNNLFDGTAVYGSHPFLSSVIQMFFARLFIGSSNFGWRISNLYLSALSLGLLYLFLKQFLNARISMMAVLLMAPAHYVMTFGKIGYNNLQALFAACLALAAGAWAVRRRGWFALTLLGLAAGLCFYVYPAALYLLPVIAILLWVYDPPVDSSARRRWLAFGLSLGMLVLPLLFQADYWREKIPGTVLYQDQIISTPGSLVYHFASNLLYAFLSFLYVPQESHFVVVSYLDALSGILFVVGLCALLLSGWKNRFWSFILASFVSLLVFVGASHGGRFPPTTRMFLLLPIWALIGALGLEWLAAQLRNLPRPMRFLSVWLPAFILLCVCALNLYQAYVLSPQRSTGYQSPAMLFVRILEHIRWRSGQGPLNLTLAFLTTPPWGTEGYSLMLRTYDIPTDMLRLAKIEATPTGLPPSSVELLSSPRTLTIIYPEIEASLKSALEEQVRAIDKLPCPMRALNGVIRFELWVSPSMEWICAAGQ